MPSNPYMPLFVGDYLRDTVHLQTVEHGAYMLILMALWSQGGAIKSDPKYLARVARMTPTKFKNMWPSIEGFFISENGVLRHARIDRELTHIEKKRAKKVQAANSRWRKNPKKNKPTPNADAMQTQCTQPIGLGSSLQEETPTPLGKKPKDPGPATDAPARMSGGGAVAADGKKETVPLTTRVGEHGRDMWMLLRQGLMRDGLFASKDLDRVKERVIGFQNDCFTVDGAPLPRKHWDKMTGQAERLGVTFKVKETA